MGIRFRCHHCEQDLNLKDFLAGKRGRCPKCSGRFRVPLESCEFSSPIEDSEAAAENSVVSAGQPIQSFELQQPTGDSGLRAKSDSSANLARGRTSTADRSNVAGVAESKSVFTKSAKQNFAEPNPAQAKSANTNTAGTTVTKPAAASALPVQDLSAMPSAAALTSGKDSVALPQPIAEAPQAVWYVRPTSGGQFGPADAQVFFQWMKENRVARDAYVWRDGWPEWQVAGNVFESFLDSLATEIAPEMESKSEPTKAPQKATGPGAALEAATAPINTSPGVLAPGDLVRRGGVSGPDGLALPADDQSAAGGSGAILGNVGLGTGTPPRPRLVKKKSNTVLGIAFLAVVAIVLVVVLVFVLMTQ